MTPARLDKILDRARSTRVVVLGDLMLDEFVWGKVGRISPEAPVPVVEVTRETSYPGGAANVARNLREFIDSTSVIGMVGRDRGGRQLRELRPAQHRADRGWIGRAAGRSARGGVSAELAPAGPATGRRPLVTGRGLATT